MRGFPPVQIFVLGLVFGLLALPLARLTNGYGDAAGRQKEAVHHAADPNGGQIVKGGTDHPESAHRHVEVKTLLRLRFAHPPLTVSVKQGQAELAAKADLSAFPVEFTAALELSHGSNDLFVKATWPEGTPDTALTVELEPDGFETRSETRWSSASALDEVLTFTW